MRRLTGIPRIEAKLGNPQWAKPAEPTQALDKALVRGLAWTGSIRWASQAVAWASTLVVARLLVPGDYGLVGMASVYLGLLSLVAEFGVGSAVVNLRDLSGRQIAQLNGLSLLVGVAGMALSAVVAWPVGRFFRSPQLPPVIIVMSLAFVINAFQSVPLGLLQRELRFKLISFVDGIRALLLACINVSLAWLGFRYWTLVIGAVAGALISTGLVLSRRRCGFAWPRLEEVQHALRFSGHVLAGRIAWYSYSNADFVTSGRVLGQAALGAYSVAWNLANVPVDKITGVLNNVTPALFSAVQHDAAALRRYLLKLTEGVALMTLPLSIGLSLVAPEFLSLALGAKWQAAALPLRILCLYVAFRSVAPLIGTLLIAVGESRFNMWNSLMAAVLMPSSFYAGSHWGNAGIATAWLIAYPVVALPLYVRAFHRIGLRGREYLAVLLPALGGTGLLAAAVFGVKFLCPGCRLGTKLTIEIIGGAAAYLLGAGFLGYHRRHAVAEVVRLLRSEQK